ncbi:hypothetical protein MLD38_039044 [Melastoma candidum]|uniref:Uncharacterized protein n=1 Tax=Melastoma candidum TaxID=119954 RepID=A0ACB9L0U3_9MYRT|nr:hypothetical protein MLD38_039044 [Melastoma candidum]
MEDLSLGHQLAQQLHQLLHSSSPPTETHQLLLQRILSCYDRLLFSLIAPDSPSYPSSSSANRRVGGSSSKRKRKDEHDSTQVVRVGSTGEGRLEEDGFSWRKYGQKQILGAKYPRGYFRCTHRPAQGCLATKQVQRSDEEPSVFEVTYHGRHTCIPPVSTKLANQDTPTVVPPLSAHDDVKAPRPQMDVKEHIFPPSSFLEPHPPQTMEAWEEQGTLLDEFDFDIHLGMQEQTAESDPADIFLADSVIVFPLTELSFDQDLPFDDPEFFS